METSLFKFLTYEGFESIIREKKLLFSNMNRWRKESDVCENFMAYCLETESAYKAFLTACKEVGDKREDILTKIALIYVYSYKTYALCFTITGNRNSVALWNAYSEKIIDQKTGDKLPGGKDGIRIEFAPELYDDISLNNKDFSFFNGNVIYYEQIPTIKEVFGTVFDKEQYKKIAFFRKIDAYAYEKEFRFVATKFQWIDKLQIGLLPYAKKFDLSFEGIKDSMKTFLYPCNNEPFDDTKIQYTDHKLIKSIQVHPKASSDYFNKVENLCNEYNLNFSGRADIFTKPFTK